MAVKSARREHRVVVTGLGTHGAGGTSAQLLWDNTIRQIVRVEQRSISSGRVCAVYAAPEPDFAAEEARTVKHADRAAKLALCAAQQAWEDACLTRAKTEPERVGVIIGSSRGPAAATLSSGNGRARAIDAVYTAFSSIAGVVAAELGAAKCAQMTSATCISGAVALQTALFMLDNGDLDVAIVGAVDAPLVENLLEQFAAAGVLASASDASALRPFDKNRNGTAVGEGAAFVIVENEEHARARGAKIRGIIHAVATGCEPHLRSSMSMNAQGMQETVRRALGCSSLTPSDIDLAILHGTGTRMNDLMESRCLHALFGDVARQPRALGTKAITGHTLGGSALFQLLIGLESIRHGFIPGTANCTLLDPECPLRLSLGEGIAAEVKRGICLTSGFWGNSSCIIFGRP
jgi:3-oxoacyl-[acyl-carrier-protein] synthase II